MGKSFAELHPELIEEWSKRNTPIEPSDVTYIHISNAPGKIQGEKDSYRQIPPGVNTVQPDK